MKRLDLLFIPLIIFALITFHSCDENEEVGGEICNNAIDDDNDGDVDCDDSDCAAFSGCAGQGSDTRIKENVKPLTYGLDEILALDPSSFKYIDAEGTHLGLMAQDVQKLIPEIVVDDPSSDEDIMRIRYEELIPVLINAIQAQQEEIDELKASL